LALERRPTVEDFNERLETKADKQMLINGLLSKATKADFETTVALKLNELRADFER